MIPVSCRGALIEDLNEHLSAGLPSVWGSKTVLTAMVWFLLLYTEFALLWKSCIPNESHVSEVNDTMIHRVTQSHAMQYDAAALQCQCSSAGNAS